MEPIFEGTGVALVLPMFEDGSIDYEGYKRQVQRMIDGGVKAYLSTELLVNLQLLILKMNLNSLRLQ